MVKFSTTVLTQNYKCLLILFIFLSRKFVDIWLPHLIQVHKHKISITVSSSCKVSITSVDGEVNRIVGWALFATLKKYHKMAKNNENENLEKINETIEMLEDIKAIEADILQDSEYIKRYYCVDDAIRNKSKLTLISSPYIENLSILSKFISEQYKSAESLRATSHNVKKVVLKELIEGSHLSYINSLVNTSIERKVSTELKIKIG